jgi:sec-independent protein translocase protein TatA
MRLGFGEILLILFVVILIFGSSKLPQLGDAFGKTIKNFKKATAEDEAIDVTPKKLEGGSASASAAASDRATATQKK